MKTSINRVRWLRLTQKQRDQITAQIEASRADIRARKWTLTTERSYCMWIRRYGLWLALSSDARAAADSTRGVHVRASVEALALP